MLFVVGPLMAAVKEARLVTVRFDEGSVRATRAAVDKLLGSALSPSTGPSWGPVPGARRPYGHRRVTNSAAGSPLSLRFEDGEVWTYRVTGTIKNFIDQVLKLEGAGTVISVTSPRGAEFSRDVG